MKIIINQIKSNAFDQPFKFDQTVDVSELETMENDILEIKPVRVQGECTIDGKELFFLLHISGEMILPCARTLVDVPYPFDIHETEVFTTSAYYTEEDKENEIHLVEGEIIDLKPLILEDIMLSIPFRVFSDDEEALKNAVFEGEGWEYSQEAEEKENDLKQEETIDPRLQKLQSLLDDNEKDS